MRRVVAAIASIALFGCGKDETESAELANVSDVGETVTGTEVAESADAAASSEVIESLDATPALDTALVEADATASEPDATTIDELDPTEYCERAVDVFCPYYVRCGRMAAPDLAHCRAVFVETCNARYEPIYGDLAARGRLALSAAGLDACAAHLSTVVCDAQLTDLDGPCGQIWRGLSPAGAACGPGIESLVCDGQSTCVLRLDDFCGECTPLTSDGGACDPEHRCPQTAVCVDGACVPRVQTGEACTATDTCEVGADCVGAAGETRCLGASVAAVGEACGAGVRCPYKSVCSGGKCVETALLGEACTPSVGCASGTCRDGVCEPLGGPGASCTSGFDCVSSRCGGAKTCQAIGPACQ